MPALTVNYWRDILNPLLSVAQHKNLIAWLKHKGLLSSAMVCVCGKQMAWTKRLQRTLDRYIWYCGRCSKEISIRVKSIFEHFSKLPLQTIMKFAWEYSLNNMSCAKLKLCGIGCKQTCMRLKNLFLHVCMQSYNKNIPGEFGGRLENVFMVDESVFIKRKYNKGRRIKERWVFGILIHEFSPPRPIFYVIEKRNAQTLLRIIARHIKPGSTIMSDQYRSYNRLQNLGYNHMTVNHSREFVNSTTGAHTNGIELEWSHAKRFLKDKRCVTSEVLQGYLNVYLWWKWLASTHDNGVFARLLEDIAEQYPL